jgi:molecular chaperone GrpE (heat shock protein)
MRRLQSLLFVALCCGICAGCGMAKIQELTAKVASLEAKTKKLEAENAKLHAELTTANRKLEDVEAIRKGYESARDSLKKTVSQLAPFVGDAESPLPPFDGLKDSSWIGKFSPSAKIAPGLKDLQESLKDFMGNQGVKPKR